MILTGLFPWVYILPYVQAFGTCNWSTMAGNDKKPPNPNPNPKYVYIYIYIFGGCFLLPSNLLLCFSLPKSFGWQAWSGFAESRRPSSDSRGLWRFLIWSLCQSMPLRYMKMKAVISIVIKWYIIIVVECSHFGKSKFNNNQQVMLHTMLKKLPVAITSSGKRNPSCN